MLKIYRRLLPLVAWLLARLSPHFPGIESLLAPRRGLIARWRAADLGENRIWFHVSSVGELEQSRPILENLKGYSIVLSYFSSSVPKLVKDWGFVRYADYLPLDFETDMEALMEIIHPKLLVLNRYDLWPNHLAAARARGIPVVVVNASTPPLGFWGRISLRVRRGLFLTVSAWGFVDAAAAAGWEPYVSPRVQGLVTGDPRVDRALARVDRALTQGLAKERLVFWQKQKFCLVAGSTWAEDEQVLLDAWTDISFPRSLVLVPHEPDEAHLRKIEKKLETLGLSHGRFSALGHGVSWDVLLVDQRGILAEIYGAGNLAYVGGGFRKQIHSIVEPVAHGLPVVFGPNFQRSPEAMALTAAGGAFALPAHGAALALKAWIERMTGPERAKSDEPIKVFLQIHRGAGERAAEFLRRCVELGKGGLF